MTNSTNVSKKLLDAPVTKELVEYLEECFPERCPDIQDSERQIFLYAGMRKLVILLRHVYEVQSNGRPQLESVLKKADRLSGF